MAEVTIRALKKTYGGLQVIHGLDLDIVDGEFVVLVGPSGCGKSTLLRMIAGLEDITEGSLAIGGKDMTSIGPSERGVAMVFQSYAIWPHMSVFDNVAYGLRVRKQSQDDIKANVERAQAYLDKFGEGNYHCRQCGPGGGFKLLQAVRGVDFHAALCEVERCLGVLPAAAACEAGAPAAPGERMRQLVQRIWPLVLVVVVLVVVKPF